MNTTKNLNRMPNRSKIVVRLWLFMMGLVILSIAFMWVAQVFLFEKNYIDSNAAEVQSRLQPLMEELKTKDLAENDELILSLSKATNSKMALADRDGKIIAFYIGGHQQQDEQVLDKMSKNILYVMQTEEFQPVLQGNSYSKIVVNNSEPTALEIGISVTYNNSPATVVLYHSLDQLHTVLNINRNQLILLSVILTLLAALLAAVMSRHFIKPIQVIKNAVDSLAKGDLTAKPELSLNDELGELSDSVEELGKALQRVDVLRKEIIANVSHELRAPLALIAGYAEMVRDINWKNNTKRNDDLNLIISESGRMSEMVSDIMDYSQLQAGYLQLKKDYYNLYEIIESEVAHCKKNAVEYGIAIFLESNSTDLSVNVDALKISRVMRNLLNNAINHTADDKTILVSIKELNGNARVSVINPGEPIPMEDREIIWERYQRSQHQGGRKRGTGIGLSIVSASLKAHGMSYGVDCADKFTTFWFECELSNG